MNERERIVNVLKGEPIDRLPWATRLDIWHIARMRTQSVPEEVSGMDLKEIHRHLRIGRQSYSNLHTTRMRGVEMTVAFEDTVIRRETDPCMNFPQPRELAVVDKPGETIITLSTPVGNVQMRFRMVKELIEGAAAPYLVEHILKDDHDFKVVKWILDKAEIVPDYTDFEEKEALVGGDGFTIGMMDRIPFQRILLDFMGEEPTIYAMMDHPQDFQYLLDALDAQGQEILEAALASPALMLEFGDNFEGSITPPSLFKTYCMPYMQAAADKIHGEGRFLGSHMDGNMKPLLHLVPECGIDVVESISPHPLTGLTFEDAWTTWQGKVLMWGAIPSTIFEPQFPEDEFENWVKQMLDLIGDDKRIILGIGDQAVRPTLIERMRRVSEMLGRC